MGIRERLFKYKSLLLKNRFFNKRIIKYKLAKKELLSFKDYEDYLNDADIVSIKNNTTVNCVGIVPDGDEYEAFGCLKTRSYYPKFQRFCINNNLEYKEYNIYSSTWLEDSEKFDFIVWHTKSDPMSQKTAKSKLFVLDKLLGKKCLPSYDEIWSYESKIHMHYQYRINNFPEIPTFVSFNKKEAVKFCNETMYPIISKLDTGSGSKGVTKLDNKREALQLVNKVFSGDGLKTYFGFENQKDYVLFQKFIPDANYDLRVIVVGNKLFGYYRYPKKGDYKASGAGIYEKKEIPTEALEIAYRVKEKFNCRFLATDLLYSANENKYYIIESSIFIGVDTCEQLVIDGKPGYYERIYSNQYIFREGKYWLPELMLEECLNISNE